MAIDPNRIQSPTEGGADEEEALLRKLLPFAMGHRALHEVIYGTTEPSTILDEASQIVRQSSAGEHRDE